MTRPKSLRITVWATTLGPDLYTLCRYLEKREDTELSVFMPDPERFKTEAAWKLSPLRSPVYPKGPAAYARAVSRFSDITIVDNAVPYLKTSRKLFILWHGFGWRKDHLGFMKRCISLGWGSPVRPNRNFRWQCFGEWDRDFRALSSGLHAENLAVLGSAFHDEVKIPLDKSEVASHYPLDVISRKTVLLAPTWHYEGLFSQWGDEERIFSALIHFLEERNANLILRLHDTRRYEKSYVRMILETGEKYPHVFIKFRDRFQDNTVDLRLADVLVTNFSSIANYFYATGRPALHIYPVRDADAAYFQRRLPAGILVKEKIPKAGWMWKLPLEENGGLLARSEAEFFSGLERALTEPFCCRDKSRAFLDKYMMGADGRSCQRIVDSLQRFLGE